MRKKAYILICLGLVMVMLITGILLLYWRPVRILLPSVENVMKIEIEQISKGYSVDIIIIENRDDINTIFSVFFELRKASLSWYSAANDYPLKMDYLIVRIHAERESRILCLYTEGNKDYVYEPYVGIYRINQRKSAEIYKMFKNN
jgi:hypothetical protein